MRGFIAISFQALHNGKLINGLIEMRHIVKGEDGHTSERLVEEIAASVRDLAVVYELERVGNDNNLTDEAKAARIQLLNSDAARYDLDVINNTNTALSSSIGFVTDGGANMAKAARLLASTYGGGNDRARLCVSHTLQLLLKYFCIQDNALADALAS